MPGAYFFSIPMWFTWSWSSASFLKTSGITTCLTLIIILLITTLSSQNVQYVITSSGIWSLFSGHPLITYPFSHCKWLSCAVACCNCDIDIHSGMFVAVCMASKFTSMPGFSAPLLSVWFCLESQSVMNRSGPGCIIFWLRIGVFWGEYVVFFVTALQILFFFFEYCY